MAQRLAETFFRRWWLYALPIALLAVAGLYQVTSAATRYGSSGTVRVATSTLVASLSDVRGDPNYGWETPASVTSSQFNAQLQVDSFVDAVAEQAGLDDELASGALQHDDIRGAVSAWATGSNLVKVGATTTDPTAAPVLASAAIDAFIQQILDDETGNSKAAEEFYTGLSDDYSKQLQEALSERDAYLAEHPEPGGFQPRPAAESLEIARLNQAVTDARSRYDDALEKAQTARLSLRQAEADVRQRLLVVDAPETANALGSMRDSAITVAMYLVIGLLLAGAGVLVMTLLDQTVRNRDDVTETLGLWPLAIVPEVPPKEMKQARAAFGPATAALGQSVDTRKHGGTQEAGAGSEAGDESDRDNKGIVRAQEPKQQATADPPAAATAPRSRKNGNAGPTPARDAAVRETAIPSQPRRR